MDPRIEKIRELLAQLEADGATGESQEFVRNFDALEIPAVVVAIVDHLQPGLLPAEAAIYWYMFRHSVLETGQQHCRVSTRGLMTGVVRSRRQADGEALSLQTTRGALRGLEQKGVIVQAGEANRSGTPYKVLLPDEIPLCQESMKAAVVTRVPRPVDERKELDFYNVPANRSLVFERDRYQCHYCKKQLTRFTATLDHLQPVSEGGDNSFDNLVTACLQCNSRRGSRPVMVALANAAQGKGDA